MGFKNRYTAMFMILCIVLSMFSGITFADDGSGGVPQPEVPGALILDKSVTHEPDSDLWEVTVSLNGLDRITTSDVVLVIDKSGSMQGTKLANTKIAANAFVDDLLKDDNNTRIAIVTFNDTAYTNITFTNDKTKLKSEISNISALGGTNIQAGIKRGNELLLPSQANNKYIVLLGDGEPTYSYRVTDISGVTISSHSGNNPNFVLADGYTATFNYNNMVGDGSSYTLSGTNRSNIAISCPTHGSHDYSVSNNKFGTVAEANAAKNNQIEIYTVALNAGTQGEEVLRECADSGNYYQMNNNSATGLTQAFVEIAGKIAFAATNVLIDDPMGEMFTLDPSTIVFKKGGVPYTPESGDFQLASADGRDGQKIIWKIPSVENASSPITLTYTIKIEQGVSPRENFKTNGPTIVSYIDVDGVEREKEFFVPEVNSGDYGTILMKHYLVNEDGYALTEQGLPASKIEDIDVLYQEYYKEFYITDEFPEGAYLTSHHGTFSITPPAKMTFSKLNGDKINGVFVQGNGKNFGDISPASATVDVANQQVTLYFAYKVQDTFDVTFHENAGTDLVTNMPSNLTGVPSGDMISEPSSVPNRAGYAFEGWFTGLTSGSMKWLFNTDTVIQDTDLYAKWEQNEYNITYNSIVGGSTVAGGMNNVVLYNITSTVTLYDLEKVGYTFNGWFDNSGFVGSPVDSFGPGESGDKEFYASWGDDPTDPTPDEYSITYDETITGATTVGTVVTTYNVSTPTFSLHTLTKDGYTFNGWYDNDAFSGSAVSSIAEGTTGDKTFYAKWGNTGTDPIEYSIVYMDSVGGTIVGGGVGIQSPNFNVLSYNVTSTVTLYDLEKSGYTFNGWFDNAAFSGNPVTNFGPGETGDKTFHAGWKKTGGNNGGSTTGGAVVVNPETPQPADEPGSGFNEEEEDKGTKEEEPQPEPGTPRYWWWLLLLLLLLLICYGYYRYRNSKNN